MKKEITTPSGFTIKIDPNLGDDMELIEDMQKIALGRPHTKTLADVVVEIIGEDGKQALYAYCRNEETGRVSAMKVAKEVDDIFSEAVELLKKA